jgi:hypothetical protein
MRSDACRRSLAFTSVEVIKETIETIYPAAEVTVAPGIATKLVDIETEPSLPCSTWSSYMAGVASIIFSIIDNAGRGVASWTDSTRDNSSSTRDSPSPPTTAVVQSMGNPKGTQPVYPGGQIVLPDHHENSQSKATSRFKRRHLYPKEKHILLEALPALARRTSRCSSLMPNRHRKPTRTARMRCRPVPKLPGCLQSRCPGYGPGRARPGVIECMRRW